MLKKDLKKWLAKMARLTKKKGGFMRYFWVVLLASFLFMIAVSVGGTFPSEGYAYRYTDNGQRHQVKFGVPDGVLVWDLKKGGALPFYGLWFDLAHKDTDEMLVRVCYQILEESPRECVFVGWDDAELIGR